MHLTQNFDQDTFNFTYVKPEEVVLSIRRKSHARRLYMSRYLDNYPSNMNKTCNKPEILFDGVNQSGHSDACDDNETNSSKDNSNVNEVLCDSSLTSSSSSSSSLLSHSNRNGGNENNRKVNVII